MHKFLRILQSLQTKPARRKLLHVDEVFLGQRLLAKVNKYAAVLQPFHGGRPVGCRLVIVSTFPILMVCEVKEEPTNKLLPRRK